MSMSHVFLILPMVNGVGAHQKGYSNNVRIEPVI